MEVVPVNAAADGEEIFEAGATEEDGKPPSSAAQVSLVLTCTTEEEEEHKEHDTEAKATREQGGEGAPEGRSSTTAATKRAAYPGSSRLVMSSISDNSVGGGSSGDQGRAAAGRGRWQKLKRMITAMGRLKTARAMRRPTCDGVETTVMDVTILCLVLLIQVILFAGHCTPFADLLMGTQDAISYIGITLPVQVVAGLLLVPAMLLTLWQIISITCLGKRTLRRARRESVTRDILATKSSVMAIFDCVSFVFTPASSYYFVVMYLLTAQSFLAQALGVDGKARRGYGPVALTLLTTFILLNGLAPVASAWIVRRINRTADNDFYQRRIEASRWIVQLLLFEACCDLVYAFFPLAHFFARYSRITGDGTFEAGVIQAYADHTHESVGALKGAVLINEAEGTFFGSSSSLDIFVKLFSQMFPLLMAPIRIRLAFTIRQNATAGINQEKAAKMEWKSRRVPARGAFYFKNGGKAAKVQEMESVNEEPAGDFDAVANDAETAMAGSPTADIESGDGETQAAQPDSQAAEQLDAKAGKEAALPNTAEALDASRTLICRHIFA
eukprot:g104.t1